MQFQYHPLDTPLHRLDPRVKISALLLFSILLLQARLPGLAAAAASFIAIGLVGRISLSSLLRSLKPVLPFFICLFLLYLLTAPGTSQPLLFLGPVRIGREGLDLGLLQVGKFMLLVIAAALFTMSTSPMEITAGLERILRPLNAFGLSSHDLAMMVSLACRFIPEMVLEMNMVRQAQQARGAELDRGGIGRRIRLVKWLASALAVNVFRRMDGLIEAMEARGYHPGTRTYLHRPVFGRSDYIVLAALTGLALFNWL